MNVAASAAGQEPDLEDASLFQELAASANEALTVSGTGRAVRAGNGATRRRQRRTVPG